MLIKRSLRSNYIAEENSIDHKAYIAKGTNNMKTKEKALVSRKLQESQIKRTQGTSMYTQ